MKQEERTNCKVTKEAQTSNLYPQTSNLKPQTSNHKQNNNTTTQQHNNITTQQHNNTTTQQYNNTTTQQHNNTTTQQSNNQQTLRQTTRKLQKRTSLSSFSLRSTAHLKTRHVGVRRRRAGFGHDLVINTYIKLSCPKQAYNSGKTISFLAKMRMNGPIRQKNRQVDQKFYGNFRKFIA